MLPKISTIRKNQRNASELMKHFLVDTNVIIDMFLDREDADAACAVFDGAERGEVKG